MPRPAGDLETSEEVYGYPKTSTSKDIAIHVESEVETNTAV